MSVLSRVTVAFVTMMSSIALAEPPHFAYSGANGPANWSKLGPDFATCQAGESQSPVDIAGAQDVALPPLDLEYSTLAETFVNNGHAVQANYAAGSTVGNLGSTYELKQFHFHSPSEHQRDGKNLPAEVHFVHADPNGHLAVIGVFVEEGAAHPAIANLWKSLPGDEGESNELEGSISAADLLPATKDYHYYQGSLTTPPCSEGVRWLVMNESITMSADQIGALKKAIGFDNNRPVQSLNGRAILE